MNNRPITARVKSGMFKTKEPLLNVGPAGVDGNNQTRSMPSPSKMKGYAMKSSPFKQNAADKALEKTNTNYETYRDGKVILGNETKVESAGDIVRKEITKTGYKDPVTTPEGDAAYAALDQAGKDAQDKAYRDRKDNQIEMGTGEFEEVQGPSTSKTKKNEIVAKIARTGEVQTAYESRNNLRRGTQVNRKTKKAEIKNARSKAKGGGYYKTSAPDKDGKTTREFVTAKANKGIKETRKEARETNRASRKSDREDRKEEGLEGKLNRTQRKIDRKDRRKEKKATIDKAKTIKRGFKDDKSDIKAKQNERNIQLGKSESRNAQIQSTQGKSGFSKGNRALVQDEVNLQQGERSIAAQEKAVDTSEKTEKNVAASGKMKSSGFFKKKSPMKMNYFKK